MYNKHITNQYATIKIKKKKMIVIKYFVAICYQYICKFVNNINALQAKPLLFVAMNAINNKGFCYSAEKR